MEQLKNYNYYQRTFQNKDNDLLEWEKEFSRQILQVNSAIKRSIDQSNLVEHLSYLQTAHDIYDNFMESSQYFKFLKLEAKNNFEMGIRSYVKFTKIPNFWGKHKRNLQALRQEQQNIVKEIGEELTFTNEKLEK